MKIIITQDTQAAHIRAAILLYGPGQHSYSLATVHDVEMTNTGPVIKEGRAATTRSLLNMTDKLSGILRVPLTLLEPGTLAKSDEALVWWVPARAHRIAFRCEELGKRSAVVPHPPLLFAVHGNQWFVYALRDNDRPTEGTKLFQAPYFNVWNNGLVCEGSTALPAGEKIWSTAAWTKSFFSSAFTHPNVKDKNMLVVHDAGPFAFWRDMLDGKFKEFPYSALVPTKASLGSLLKQLQKATS